MTETKQDRSVRAELTDYGFTFGAAEVERSASFDDGSVAITVKTEAGRSVRVYVSPKGRSVRVFEDCKEWAR